MSILQEAAQYNAGAAAVVDLQQTGDMLLQEVGSWVHFSEQSKKVAGCGLQ
jgi:hypothetical protein